MSMPTRLRLPGRAVRPTRATEIYSRHRKLSSATGFLQRERLAHQETAARAGDADAENWRDRATPYRDVTS